MTLKNYFKIPIELTKSVFKENDLKITFQSLIMESDTGEQITFTNRQCYFRPELNTKNVCLMLQNDGTTVEERFDYLMDEEWEVVRLSLEVLLEGKPVPYVFVKSGMEQVESMEWFGTASDLEKRILDYTEVENTVCIQGPKPDKMFGYDMNLPAYRDLIESVKEELEKCVQAGKNVVLTNGYIGGDVIGFTAAQELKQIYKEIVLVVAVPFKQLDAKWAIKDKIKYQDMIHQADVFIEIDTVPNYRYGNHGEYMKEKFIKKGDFNMDHASAFIVIKDYEDTMSGIIRKARYHGKYLKEMFYDDNALPFN